MIAALLLVWVGMSSCSDFLDRYPMDELSDGSFWKTPQDAEMFVANIYKILPGGDTGDIDGDINSDNAVHGIKWAAGNLAEGIYDPQDFGWQSEYEYIRACNVALQKIDMIENYPQEDKEKTIAEARFFRAYIYFTLIREFGDVPYVDEPLNLDEMEGYTRTSKDVIYDKVMEDFDYAISKLPVQWPASKYGRITRGGAQAMKARAALYFADWQVAADASKAVIDLGEYELFDAQGTGRYAELFWESQEMCSEAVLVRQFNNPENTHYLLGWGCFPTLGWGGLNPTQSLVDAFECIDGAPITTSPLYNEKKPFENRDLRCEVCILHDGEERYGVTIKVAPLKSSGNTGIAQHGDATATGYYNGKYLDPSIDPQTTGWDMGKDWHVIRFAEVLLTYAEVKNEISPLDATALDAVNRVRRRVSLPELQTTDPSRPTYCGTQDDLRQRIRNEWRVEFAMEGNKRMWDIRRWGIAKEVMNAPFLGLKYKIVDNPDAPDDDEDGGKMCILYEGDNIILAPRRYEDHNYVMPIPQSERDLNPALTQNSGYN